MCLPLPDQSLGQEDPLMEEMATHSSILSWKNPMDRGAWWATVHGFAKSQTWLSDNIKQQVSTVSDNSTTSQNPLLEK